MNDRGRDLTGLHPASVVGSLFGGRVEPGPASTDAVPDPEPGPARGRARRLQGLAAALSRRGGDAAAAPAPRGVEPSP